MLEQFPIYEYFGKLAAWLPNALLDGTIDFNCAVRPFQKRLASLQDIYPRLVNLQVRKPA